MSKCERRSCKCEPYEQGKNGVYEIHDNGGVPFRVIVKEKAVEIEVQEHPTEEEEYMCEFQGGQDPKMKYVSIGSLGYENIWLGTDISAPGNTILVLLPKTDLYVQIGRREIKAIWFRDPNEHVQEYGSPIGNNDVAYPYILSNKGMYFNDSWSRLPISMLDKQQLKKNPMWIADLFYNTPQIKSKIEKNTRSLYVATLLGESNQGQPGETFYEGPWSFSLRKPLSKSQRRRVRMDFLKKMSKTKGTELVAKRLFKISKEAQFPGTQILARDDYKDTSWKSGSKIKVSETKRNRDAAQE